MTGHQAPIYRAPRLSLAAIKQLVDATGGVELAAAALRLPAELVEGWIEGGWKKYPNGPQREALIVLATASGVPASAIDALGDPTVFEDTLASTPKPTKARPAAASSPSRTRALTRQIANRLMAAGEIPSAERVRKLIADETEGRLRPSTNTVQDEMQAWRDQEFWPTWGLLNNPVPDLELTEGLTNEFVARLQASFATTFRALAVDIAQASDQRYLAAKSALEKSSVAIEADLANARAANAELEAAARKADVTTTNLRRQLDVETIAVGELRAAVAAAAAAADEMRQALAAAEMAHATELDRVKSAHDAAIHAVQVDLDAARQLARREGERAQAEAGRANAESARTAVIQTRADALADELSGARAELATRTTQLVSIRSELTQSTAAAARALARADSVAADLKAAQGHLTRLETLYGAEQATVATRNEEIGQLRARSEGLFGDLSVAKAEIERLTAALGAAQKKTKP